MSHEPAPAGRLPPSALPAIPSQDELHQLQALSGKFPWLFPAYDPRSQVTVGEVIETYLQHSGEELSPRTAAMRADELAAFRKAFGRELVSSLAPYDLKQWLKRNRRWASPNTRKRVKAGVLRCLNWAADMRLIRENPLSGMILNETMRTGRDMKQSEYQAILRASDLPFKRFLVAMRLTGARPGELSRLRWEYIDWEKGIATLKEHKTARKTGKARNIVFPPNAIKLLSIMRRDHVGSAACELRRLLMNVPGRRMKSREVVTKMKCLGFTYRRIYLARRAIGAVYRRVGGYAENGYTVCELPASAKAEALPPVERHVFLNSKGRPWTWRTLGTKFGRLRKLLGLPMDCKLYGLRHTWITEAVKHGANFKAVATLAGHSSTAMLDLVYTHIDRDFEYLRKVATQAVGLPTPGHMPDKNGVKAPGTPPQQDDGEPSTAVLLQRRITELERQLKQRPVPVTPSPKKLQPSEELAYRARQWAIKENPALAEASDKAVYLWLVERPEWRKQLPPLPKTFHRYCAKARAYYGERGLRDKRREGFTVPTTEES